MAIKPLLQPSFYTQLGKHKLITFHFWGIIGYVAGSLTGLIMAATSAFKPSLVLALSALAAITFVGLAWLGKVLSGKESLVFYRMEIAIGVVGLLFLNAIQAPLLPYLELLHVGIGIFLAFGRIGCHNAGCCHGKQACCGVQYPAAYKQHGFPWWYLTKKLVPTQLIEALLCFIIIIASIWVWYSGQPQGATLLWYFYSYALIRYVLEFFRGDQGRPYWLHLSEGQWTSLLVCGLMWWFMHQGTLPHYTAYTVLTVLISLYSLLIVAYRFINASRSFGFYNPLKVKALAKALQATETQKVQLPQHAKQQQPKVYAIQQLGISLSSGKTKTPQGVNYHYTISGKPGMLNQPKALSLAQQIAKLKGFKRTPNVKGSTGQPYHIIFSAE